MKQERMWAMKKAQEYMNMGEDKLAEMFILLAEFLTD